MKKYIYFPIILVACWLMTACHENEIEFYNQSPRLNFDRQTEVVIFADSDYVRKTEYKPVKFTVMLQGDLLQAKRSFALRTARDTTFKTDVEMVIDKSYEYTAIDTVAQTYTFKVKRPKDVRSGRTEYGSFLEFDANNPANMFDRGLEERQRLLVTVRWVLRPSGWEDWQFGTYSDAKYIYIMDLLHCTYDQIESDEDIEKVKETYKKYLEDGNAPILDDKGNPISFEY